MKLYSQLGHHRTLRVKLVAKLSELELEAPILLEADLNKLKDKSPLGIFPTLEAEGSLVSGSAAICRQLSTKSKSHFNLQGTTPEEKAQVDSWLDWVQFELEPMLLTWLYMVLGHVEGDAQLYHAAIKDTKAQLAFLDKHFEKVTFLAGGKYYSLADAALCSLLYQLFSLCITKEEMASTPNLARYFLAFVSFKTSQSVLGSFKFCTSKLEPTFTGGAKKEEGGEKKGGEKKEQGKKGENKKGGEKKKEEPKPASDKEEKERKRQEALELELKQHDEKVKKWLEAECTFDFEEFKRVYCNAQPGQYKQVFEWLWKHQDENQVSFHHLRFDKLPNELKIEIATYNKCQGFIDRTDNKAARFGFGVQLMWWDEKDKEQEIRGLQLFKGTEIPYPFETHQMLEYHKVTKLEPTKNKKDKELIETYLGSRYSANGKLEYEKLKLAEFFKWQ